MILNGLILRKQLQLGVHEHCDHDIVVAVVTAVAVVTVVAIAAAVTVVTVVAVVAAVAVSNGECSCSLSRK